MPGVLTERYNQVVEISKKTVGERVRALRVAAGFRSADALAEAIGVHPNTVYELERGINWISPEMLVKLAPVLKASPPDFFKLDDSPLAPAVREIASTFARMNQFQRDSVITLCRSIVGDIMPDEPKDRS